METLNLEPLQANYRSRVSSIPAASVLTDSAIADPTVARESHLGGPSAAWLDDTIGDWSFKNL